MKYLWSTTRVNDLCCGVVITVLIFRLEDGLVNFQFYFLHKPLSLAWNLNVHPDSFQADDLCFRHLLGLLHSARKGFAIPVETSEFVAGVVGLFVHNSIDIQVGLRTGQAMIASNEIHLVFLSADATSTPQ